MAGGEGEGVTNLQLNALVGEFGDTDLRALQVTQQGNKTAMLGSNIAHQLGTSLVLVGGAVGEIQTGNVQASQNQLFENFRRSEEHTSELQSLMRISYAVFCLKK